MGNLPTTHCLVTPFQHCSFLPQSGSQQAVTRPCPCAAAVHGCLGTISHGSFIIRLLIHVYRLPWVARKPWTVSLMMYGVHFPLHV